MIKTDSYTDDDGTRIYALGQDYTQEVTHCSEEKNFVIKSGQSIKFDHRARHRSAKFL